MSLSPIELNPTRLALRDDHRRLDDLFSEVMSAADANVDLRTLGETWTRFEMGLRSHLAMEEELVFPALKAKHPDEVLRLQGEHDDIRSQLDALDIAVDLHFVRAREVRDLVKFVRAHAIAEDARMYRWANAEVAGPERKKLLHWLGDPKRWPQGDAA